MALAAGAHIDPLEHFDDLAALDAAARAQERLPIDYEVGILGLPVLIGDPDGPAGSCAALYRLSYGALRWIEECARLWFEGDPLYGNLAVAWAMAHARDSQAFRGQAADRRQARRTIAAWATSLNCSVEELVRATSHLLGPSTPVDALSGNRPAQYPDPAERLMLARLVREFGQHEDYWLFCDPSTMYAALDYLRRQDEAEGRAIAKASGKSQPRDPDSPEVKAFAAWRQAARAFLGKFAPRAMANPDGSVSTRPGRRGARNSQEKQIDPQQEYSNGGQPEGHDTDDENKDGHGDAPLR